MISKRAFAPLVVLLPALLAAAPAATPPPPSSYLPLRLNATVMVLNAPKTGIVRLRLTIDRWTTLEQKKALVRALKDGGTDKVVEAMDGLQAGYLQIDDNLRWPLRVASMWPTEKGIGLRVATNRPIAYGEIAGGYRSQDYPIGIVEINLPAEGTGDGTLLAATEAGFDDQGRIEMRSLPTNTGPQKLSNVERQKPKKDKKKS